MSNLFLLTLEMMGLTFAIGFFVAGVIKLTASTADYFEFYNLNKLQLKRLQRWRKERQKTLRALVKKAEEMDKVAVVKHYYGASKGNSDFDVMDYYYPRTAKFRRSVKSAINTPEVEQPKPKRVIKK